MEDTLDLGEVVEIKVEKPIASVSVPNFTANNVEDIVQDVNEIEIPIATQDEMLQVLRNFAQLGVIGVACDKSGVRRKTHFDWCGKYPKYKAVYEELKERFVDGLEMVAIERAKEKSDSLLQLLLRSYRRDTFGDQSRLDINTPGSGVTLMFAEGMLTDEEKQMIKDGGPNVQET